MNSFCASEVAATKRSWTFGRSSNRFAAVSVALRARPAIGTARGWRFAGSFSLSAPATSVFA